MVRISIVSPVVRTSSLSQGYFDFIEWPQDMPPNLRRVWCRILAQTIGPLREHLKDSTCPLVAPGSPAERELEDARLETEEKRLEVFKLVTRVTELEIAVRKRMEELEQVAGAWADPLEAMTELELVFVRQKLQRMKNYKRTHNMSPGPRESSVQRSGDVVAVGAPRSSFQRSDDAAAVETIGEGRGRDKQASMGSRARHHSPLMLPVVWGYQDDAPTGMLPKEVLQEYMTQPDSCIIRRSTPDAHPRYRLLAPDHEALQEFRPRT